MAELKVIAVGNSLGVILPRDTVAHLGIQKGDTLFATEGVDSVALSVRAPDLDEQLAVARRIMRERFAVLRELAK